MSNVILESLVKTTTYLDGDDVKVCSISGGSDSDVVIDVLNQCGHINDVHFVFYDTGLEYKATKDHLDDLEKKYNIQIERRHAFKSIPYCCNNYGIPFLSKKISDMICRLQAHNFKFEDEPFDVLIKKYPRCRAALRWWCNDWGEGSRFNISYHKYLKEFMIAHPPNFQISNKCCDYAKKKTADIYFEEVNGSMIINGVRKSEGGARSTAYKSCFEKGDKYTRFMPIFWYTNQDKREYEEKYGVQHSKCYTEYGLKRTGCCGCPYGRDFENELEIIKKYEPNLYIAVNNIFGKSYEYTREYIKFREEKSKGYKINTLYQYLDA